MAVYELTMMSVKKYQMEVMMRVERALKCFCVYKKKMNKYFFFPSR